MIRFAPPMEQVCTSHTLDRLPSLHIILEICIFVMFFVFLPPHVVFCLFLNLLVIIMSLLNFIALIFSSRIGTLRGCLRHGLYALDAPLAPHAPQVFSGVHVSSTHWHARLGHPTAPIVRHVLHRHDLPVVSNKVVATICDACQQGKSHQLPYNTPPCKKGVTTTTTKLNLLVEDSGSTSPVLSDIHNRQ